MWDWWLLTVSVSLKQDFVQPGSFEAINFRAIHGQRKRIQINTRLTATVGDQGHAPGGHKLCNGVQGASSVLYSYPKGLFDPRTIPTITQMASQDQQKHQLGPRWNLVKLG